MHLASCNLQPEENMFAYLVRRLFYAILTVWAVSIVAFVIIQLPPGDYVTAYLAQLSVQGSTLGMSEAANLRAYYGLDRPMYYQYYLWLERMFHGDFGFSFEHQKPVKDVIGERLNLTIILALTSVLFTWALAIPIGIYSAVRQYSVWDYFFTFVGFIGLAIPNFLLALLLMWVGFSVFGLSVGGLFSTEHLSAEWSWARIWDLLQHLWLPVVILGMAGTAQIMRITRANVLDELRKPYVVTARAKGLSGWRLVLKYPARIALNPVISVTAYVWPYLVSGSIIVSVVLSLP
ncbi:MAG: ABC transporter permease, partial [Caldilineaceae bacterium]|nr:ABC transporter permease [Caldilineaceae bacterium]